MKYKEIILTNLEIFEIFEVLNKLKNKNIKTSGYLNYKILINHSILYSYYNNILEYRNELIQKYQDQEDTKSISEENFNELKNKIKEYEKIENKIRIILFNYKDLKKININILDLEKIFKIIKTK